MDLEARKRAEVRAALEPWFNVWEEVQVETHQGKLRVDVVAIPKSPDGPKSAIGFEVKSPNTAMNFQNWAKVFKQAADYVGSRTIDKRLPDVKISSVFVFPSPPYVSYLSPPSIGQEYTGDWFRQDQLLQYAGVIHLAQHFRVGHASWSSSGVRSVFQLSMGPNGVWNQRLGWFKTGKDLVGSSRVGSKVKS